MPTYLHEVAIAESDGSTSQKIINILLAYHVMPKPKFIQQRRRERMITGV